MKSTCFIARSALIGALLCTTGTVAQATESTGNGNNHAWSDPANSEAGQVPNGGGSAEIIDQTADLDIAVTLAEETLSGSGNGEILLSQSAEFFDATKWTAALAGAAKPDTSPHETESAPTTRSLAHDRSTEH